METTNSTYILPRDTNIINIDINGNILTITYSSTSDVDKELKYNARKAIKEWASQPENATKILEMMAKSQKD